MNILKRSITSNLCFSSHPSRKWRFLLFSTTYTLNPPKSPKRSHTPPAPTPSSSKVEAVKLADVPRPIEIPYQAKVANLVNLIGHIKAPVKFLTSPDSKYWASTVIYQESGRHHSCLIPVVFEGDLAHVVSFHVKENDCVYVTGRLSEDPLPLVLSETPGKLHLRVENVHFVQGYEKQRSRKTFGGNLSSESDDIVMASKEYRGGFLGEKGAGESIVFPGGESYRTSKKSVGSKKGEDSGLDNSGDLVQNSREGWDYFERKSKGLVSNKYPDFEHEDTGAKCIGESIVAPVGENYRTSTRSKKGEDPVLDSHLEQKSQGLLLNKYPGGENHQSSIKSVVGTKKGEDSVLDSWRDLVQNSREWRDYREQKSKGLLSNKYPDFKHKDTGAALWLGRSSPEWVLGGLESLEFYVPPPKQKQGQKQGKDVKEYLFKSLAENPSDWWDNRWNKKNPKAPDFKHKTSGEALWLDSLPDWVLSKLPLTGEKQNVSS